MQLRTSHSKLEGTLGLKKQRTTLYFRKARALDDLMLLLTSKIDRALRPKAINNFIDESNIQPTHTENNRQK